MATTPEIPQLVIRRSPISSAALRSLYGASVNIEYLQVAIDKSMAVVHAAVGDEVVGFGRLVGDGSLYLYIQDLMVLPSYRDRGVGRAIMEECHNIVRELSDSRKQVLLIADDAVKAFYERLGYVDTGPRNHLMRIVL